MVRIIYGPHFGRLVEAQGAALLRRGRPRITRPAPPVYNVAGSLPGSRVTSASWQRDRLKRREFIALIGGATVAWPHTARAQQQEAPVIGFLSSRSAADSAYLVAAFHRGLSESGFVEGQNVGVEYRWAAGRNDRLPAFAVLCRPWVRVLRQHIADGLFEIMVGAMVEFRPLFSVASYSRRMSRTPGREEGGVSAGHPGEPLRDEVHCRLQSSGRRG
jgi:hypothetical protein